MPLNVAYVGMTHLGLCSAVAAAELGCDVIGLDFAGERIAPLRAGRLPVSEPDLPELLAANRARLRFSDDPADLADRDLIYVAPDVPTDSVGRSDLAPVEELLARVDQSAPADTPVVLLSQVPPGFTRRHPRQQGSLFYQVETLIFGRAMERALRPERTIVGCADPAAGLPGAYQAFLERFGAPVLPMRYESAELAKISINVCLAASLSAANTLAELCEGIGAVWSEIVPALRLDRRIGPWSYIEAGLGIAGGNIERDLATVASLARETGSDARVVESFIANSERRRDWALRALLSVLPAGRSSRVAILGLAYKPDTASTKNSPALALIDALRGFELHAYDPVVKVDPTSHPRVATAPSALAACADADAVAILTAWPEFRELKPLELARDMRGRSVVDPFGVLDAHACREAGLEHLRLGTCAR